MLHELQARFRAALLDGDDAPLAGMAAAGGAVSVARRIAVHRNTVFGTLTDSLAAAFPVVRMLVGERFFAAAARSFIRAHPPERPDLAAYGGAFPGFLHRFPPAAEVPYLGDVARLEWARVEASFAADAAPLALDALAALPPEAVPGLIFAVHPSVRIVRSDWPVQAIWDAHRSDPVAAVDLAAGGECVLVVRTGATLVTLRLDPAGERFVEAIAGGRSFARAAAAALAVNTAFPLQAALAALLGNGVLTAAAPQAHEGESR